VPKKTVELAEVTLPELEPPTAEPVITGQEYERRIAATLERMTDQQLDFLLVYGDREHFPNLSYLTGFDPRFEEALLVLDRSGNRTLLLGNEGIGYADICPIDLRRELFQSFGLVDMPRGQSQPLATILGNLGLRHNRRVGIAGWKYFDERETATPRLWLEIPAFIVDTVRELAGDTRNVINAAALFMHPDTGLRTVNSVDQLAAFEVAACYTSNAVRRVLFGIQPGMTELEAVTLMQLNGLPLNCHVMLSAGSSTQMLLRSPRLRPIQRGESFFVAHGLRGALNARAGFVVEDAEELPESARGYVEDLVAPYFAAVAAWYSGLRIGATGGALNRIVQQHAGAFDFTLTPGQLIHLEEWISSPFVEGSAYVLKSGMAIQADFIPAPHRTGQFTTNMEDTLALADSDLRAAFATKYPDAWSRIQQRRGFMRDTLGIELPPEVLPFSNISAFLPPFLLRPELALVIRG
jgi:hypothetical protein